MTRSSSSGSPAGAWRGPGARVAPGSLRKVVTTVAPMNPKAAASSTDVTACGDVVMNWGGESVKDVS